MSTNLIVITRRLGYKAYRCSTCGEYGRTSDGEAIEDFLVKFTLSPVKDMEPRSVRINLCRPCLNVLEEACYAAWRGALEVTA